MATIRPIDSGSVHRIHSGQVVLELQGAIKELVENSLDAGATSIEVRIKDNGLDTVEVIDNGSGIAAEDWAYVARKHHTSKLPSLEDLPQVTTFGFRGEALSALCALCESVTIVTATQEMAPMGAVLKLGRDGSILDDSGRVARPRGTTISLQGLFTPLPVRRKEFERNAKKEITKALTLLIAYALVPASSASFNGTESKSGVRLKVEAVAGGKTGKRTSLLSNDGRGSLRASVISVWGVKALEGVQDIDIEVDLDVDPRARREGDSGHQTIRVAGLISSAAWGMGRSSPDRQYFYVNGRPCDLKVVQKVVNETYRSFNTHQVPLAVLDFQIPRDAVDINVSPDKRTIMLHSEANLIAALKTKLEEFFTPSRSTYVAEGATQTVSRLKKGLTQTLLVPQDQSPSQSQHASSCEEITPLSRCETPQPATSPSSATRNASRTMTSCADQRIAPTRSDSRQATSSGSEDEDTLGAASVAMRPSRQPRQQINIDRLDEDESSGSDGEVAGSSTDRNDRRTTSRSNINAAAGPSRPVRQTISTVTASWSPDRKRANTTNGKSATTSSLSSATRSSGRAAQQRLRERLKGFASQSSQVTREEEQSSDDEREAEEGQAEEEEDLDVCSTEEEEPEPGPERDEYVEGNHTDEPESADAEEVEDKAAAPAAIIDSSAMEIDEKSDHELPMEESESARSSATTKVGNTQVEPVQETFTDIAPPPPSRAVKSSSSSSFRDEIASTGPSGTITLSFDLTRLEQRYARRRAAQQQNGPHNRATAFDRLGSGSIAAAAGIGNKDAETAERALSRVISKPDFARMEILGQFNKGFIITRLRGTDGDAHRDDLFIVDQHASDEKFNFETLQRETVIKGQHLIKPRALQLTAGDEIVAAENMEVLRANGFEVAIDEEKPPGRGERISLLAMPVSKDTTFDFKDLEQLLHILGDSARPTGQMVRCSKARAMFAMRACRKSVMIGKSLTKSQMTQLVRNMGTIDQPWNCPHGRPTMRHLTTLDMAGQPSQTRVIPWASWAAS